MNRSALFSAAFTSVSLLCLACSSLAAQERGSWQAESKTATAITGDVTFGDEKLLLNFTAYPIAEIRKLTPAERNAVFSDGLNADSQTASGAGHLFRVSIPGEKKFLHKNTLCGSDEVTWIVTSVSGKQMQLALFSGTTPPVLTIDAIGKTTDLCGTFTYTR